MTNTARKPASSVDVRIVNAFVRDGEGGNPAGVVLDADHLSDADMQAIAAGTGLSETAFVSGSDIADFKLDFFTPTRRIAHCGHATVGTFSLLASLGRVGEGASSKETVDGPRAIEIRHGAAFMEQLAPAYFEELEWGSDAVREQDVLTALGLTQDDLLPGGNPVVVDTGNRFLLVGVKDPHVLEQIAENQDLIEAISEDLDLIGFYPFALPGEGEITATTRMFAPRYGIREEAATGMAAGPLACLLHDRFGVSASRILIEQGRYMTPASVSLLDVRLSLQNGAISGLMAGGYGKVVREQTVSY
ncbi:PhzF family phenazine biosynthesis protein [Roseibium album]|uniref:PhzF family phenazine biosynthesis protein n=1 Tax=Roseibium album TaxID=311410 RepID=UPI00391AF04F